MIGPRDRHFGAVVVGLACFRDEICCRTQFLFRFETGLPIRTQPVRAWVCSNRYIRLPVVCTRPISIQPHAGSDVPNLLLVGITSLFHDHIKPGPCLVPDASPRADAYPSSHRIVFVMGRTPPPIAGLPTDPAQLRAAPGREPETCICA